MKKTIIVAGITRSGLTLTMQMLASGGYDCVGEFPAFEEHETGDIPYDELKGKAIKVVDTHMQFPPEGEYYVIRLRRDLEQQAKSMVKFLQAIGFPFPIDPDTASKMQESMPADYAKIDEWAEKQHKMLVLDFEDLINDPINGANKIVTFLDEPLSIEKMAECVVKRGTDCYDGMLEYELIQKLDSEDGK